tara:strand:- start:1324 stop:2139 length:816 start_codon:yes stop_codon:yes gene_type:complete
MIRTIHHFAATGGTLMSKCIAAQQNVVLLSEVHPDVFTGVKYDPTAMVQQFHAHTNLLSVDHCKLMFQVQLEVMADLCKRNDLDLVLRDHTHVDFFFRDYVGTPVKDYSAEKHQVKSLVTVRHPVESFLSAKKQGWTKCIQDSFDEYCKRYIQFLNCYNGCSLYYYEEFCLYPQQVMQMICAELELRYNPDFMDTFANIVLTGDSGRRNSTISLPPAKEVPPELAEEIHLSTNWNELTTLLNYRYSKAEGATMGSVNDDVDEVQSEGQVAI